MDIAPTSLLANYNKLSFSSKIHTFPPPFSTNTDSQYFQTSHKVFLFNLLAIVTDTYLIIPSQYAWLNSWIQNKSKNFTLELIFNYHWNHHNNPILMVKTLFLFCQWSTRIGILVLRTEIAVLCSLIARTRNKGVNSSNWTKN